MTDWYHGCSLRRAEEVSRIGFPADYRPTMGNYGPGLYLSDRPKTGNNYGDMVTRQQDRPGAMLVLRASPEKAYKTTSTSYDADRGSLDPVAFADKLREQGYDALEVSFFSGGGERWLILFDPTDAHYVSHQPSVPRKQFAASVGGSDHTYGTSRTNLGAQRIGGGITATAAPLDPWRPSGGMFKPGKETLDPAFFDGFDLKDEVRDTILGTLDAFWTPKYGDWRKWAKVYLAGSAASYWWDTDSDLDILIGVDLQRLRIERPANREISDADIIAHLNHDLTEELRPTTTTLLNKTTTWFVNPGAYDIRALHPYAAYDLTADEWVVKPPKLPRDWSWDDVPEEMWRRVDMVIREAQQVLSLPEPDRTIAGNVLYDWVHEGRRAAYSGYGQGWMDAGNIIYQSLEQHPDRLLPRLYECHKAMQALEISKAASLPDNLTFFQFSGHGWEGLDAVVDGQTVGSIQWATTDQYGHEPGEVESVEVFEGWQRRGIATELLRRAREIDPRVHHSTNLTGEGLAWSQKAARLGEGWYHACSPRRKAEVEQRGHFPADYRPRSANWGPGVYVINDDTPVGEFGNAIVKVEPAWRNPITFDQLPFGNIGTLVEHLPERMRAEFEPILAKWKTNTWAFDLGEKWAAFLQRHGHDGMILNRPNGEKWGVVFDPTDAKVVVPMAKTAARTFSGGTIYRGLKVDLPAEVDTKVRDLLAMETDEESYARWKDKGGKKVQAGEIIVRALERSHWDPGVGLGRHWTERREMALGGVQQGGQGAWGILLTATYRPEDVDPDWDPDAPFMASEAEVRLKPGAEITITNVEVRHYGQMVSVWHEPIRAKADYNMAYYAIDWSWQAHLDRLAGGRGQHDLTKTRTMPLLERLARQILDDHGHSNVDLELVRHNPTLNESEADFEWNPNGRSKVILRISSDMRNKWTVLHEMVHALDLAEGADEAMYYDNHGEKFKRRFTDLLRRYGDIEVDLSRRAAVLSGNPDKMGAMTTEAALAQIHEMDVSRGTRNQRCVALMVEAYGMQMPVGWLSWDKTTKVLEGIWVNEHYRGQGIATGLLEAAERLAGGLLGDSGEYTPEGLEWAKKRGRNPVLKERTNAHNMARMVGQMNELLVNGKSLGVVD